MAADEEFFFSLARDGFVFSAEIISPHNDDAMIQVEATQPSSERCWFLKISPRDLLTVTNKMCSETRFFFRWLQDAASDKIPEVTLEIKLIEPQNEQSILTLFVIEEESRRGPKKQFILSLKELQLDLPKRLEKIVIRQTQEIARLSKIVEEFQSGQKFLFDPEHVATEHLTLSEDRRSLRCHSAGEHWLASPGEEITKGVHFWCLRVVNTASNCVFVGVLKQTGKGNKYGFPQYGANGVQIYGSGGYRHVDSGSSRSFTAEWGTGAYVGVLLDMNRRKVSFEVQGAGTTETPLDEEGGYYLCASLHTKDDSIEVIPGRCWTLP